ncbi:MAG: hypothetical protein EXR77_02910 [Myxococcales bacterium]|nr:hypothetical protein [Myxococcales bacterium]
MPTIALVTTAAARPVDDDLPLLLSALGSAGATAVAADWDDPAVQWNTFDLAVMRCPWDYTRRLPEFLGWLDRVETATRVLNSPAVVRHNIDKHYLAELRTLGLPVVPTMFLEPLEDTGKLRPWLDERWHLSDCVVKPCVGAGSQDALRFGPTDRPAACTHAQRLLAAGRAAMVQPYLQRVDSDGETALIFLDGLYSHSIRKGPLLRTNVAAGPAMFAPENIAARQPAADELALAQAIVATYAPKRLLYARVDVLRDDEGAPCLLELELTEPSLFFALGPGSAQRLAQAILRRL